MENYSKKFGASTDYKLCTITPKHLNINLGNTSQNNLILSNSSDIRKNTKTPIRTPLKLNSSKKKTPHTITDDRYIPNRTATNMETSYHLLVNANREQENIIDPQQQHLLDNIKRKLINDTCQGVSSEKEKVLHLRTKPIEQDQVYAESIKILFSTNTANSINAIKKNTIRNVQLSPEKILDAPDFRDDFYLNLIDWSSTNNLAVALNRDLYVWNATNKDIFQLFSMDENAPDYITSVGWIQKGNILAIGNSKNVVELWDINKKVCLRQMKSHSARIGCLAWNSHMLSSGSRLGEIHNHDVRIAKHHTSSLKTHIQEICGLKWNNDGRHLASGANDNIVAIWDLNSFSNSEVQPLHMLRDHTAAVKALAWCPWQNNVLATGGGTLDRSIKIWNMYNGGLLQNHDVKSQVSSLFWNKYYKELISSHGFQQNQLSLWKYPDMTKVCDLTGHSNRILGMSMSPDEETVVSVGADETLRFWRCFGIDEKLKKSKDLATDKENYNQTGLSRSIR